ncbi:hypothetical protein G3N18_02000 [Microbacterium sp. 2C]|uniref:hypothetical protein n=1 Tax=Microbacterium paulum TaxID=2707006 RepID=UPI0018C1E173|nr:hypothetical protein [Microbacterium paulum]MBG0716860.1 hypothetical protein [Microbacterium paulum]
MSTISDKVTKTVIDAQARVREGIDRLTEEPESGLDDAAWKAIWITVGGAAAIAIATMLFTWGQNYIQTRINGF